MDTRLKDYLKRLYERGYFDGWHRDTTGSWTGGKSEEEIEKEIMEIITTK